MSSIKLRVENYLKKKKCNKTPGSNTTAVFYVVCRVSVILRNVIIPVYCVVEDV